MVEFAASLPEDLKIRGFQQKFILKRVMRNKLPAAVLRRPKKGFDIPTHEWFRGFLRPLLMDTLTRDAIESTGIFNFSAIQRLIRDHMERRSNAGYHLWGLLTLFLWLKKWNIETAPTGRILVRVFRAGAGRDDLIVVFFAAADFSAFHYQSAVSGGRCGCGPGADCAQYAPIRRLGNRASGWRCRI